MFHVHLRKCCCCLLSNACPPRMMRRILLNFDVINEPFHTCFKASLIFSQYSSLSFNHKRLMLSHRQTILLGYEISNLRGAENALNAIFHDPPEMRFSSFSHFAFRSTSTDEHLKLISFRRPYNWLYFPSYIMRAQKKGDEGKLKKMAKKKVSKSIEKFHFSASVRCVVKFKFL